MKQCAMKEVNKTLSTTSLLVNTYDIRALTQYTQWETCQGNTQIAAMTFDLESNGEMNNYFSSMLVKSLSLHMTSMQTYVSSVHRKTTGQRNAKHFEYVSSATPTLGMMSWSVWIFIWMTLHTTGYTSLEN